MWRRLQMFLPGRAAWRKLALPATVAGLIALAFCWGRSLGQSPPPSDGSPLPGLSSAAAPYVGKEYAGRPVAYVYSNIPVTREELGDYLIARYGPERVDFLVNRKIIDRECQRKGVFVTDAEVEAQLIEDLRSMNVTSVDQFVSQVLNRFKKTLYEYKEDVIRPKLAMIKLVRPTITVTEQDLRDAFEAHYGPKVHCRMIVLPKDMDAHKLEIWTKVSESAEEFDRVASHQFIKVLAAKGGDAPPIYHHFSDPEIEKAAFNLKPGELSPVITVKGEGTQAETTFVILKCVEHIRPDTTKRLEDERLKLHKEVMETRLLQEIPRYFNRLRAEADPRVFLRREANPEEATRRINALLQAAARERQASEMPAAPGGAATLQHN